ncbi:hypothetical protein AB0939_00760 [Streptomyces sp. NPDC006990]|uniref:hypothetical protein n=1 Tax=unclassified Streptomyces TaxID=2593676 RepID=UPI0034561990
MRATGFALGRNSRDALAAVGRLTAGKELMVHGGDGADVQGVPPAAPYGRPLVGRGPPGRLQVG